MDIVNSMSDQMKQGGDKDSFLVSLFENEHKSI